MDRRDVLEGVVGTLGVAAATPADAGSPRALDDDALRDELRGLRRDLERIERAEDLGLAAGWRQVGLGNRPVDLEAVSAAHDRLVRSTLRTLVIADTLSALPEANRQDDLVLDVVAEHAAEMEYALQGQALLLARQGPDARRALRRTLQEDPDQGLGLGEHLDRIAAGGGLPGRRRRRLGALVKHTNWRLQRQPVETLTHELAEGVDRRGGMVPDALRERLRARVEARGTLPVWQRHRDDLERALQQADPADEERGDPLKRASGDRLVRIAKTELTISAVCAGVGALLLLNGVVLAGSSGASALGAVLIVASLFPLTGFVVLLIVGLITLAIGLSRRQKGSSSRVPLP